VTGIDNAIKSIDSALSTTNFHYNNVVKDHVRGQGAVTNRKQQVATPAFITPTKQCKDSYPESGRVFITYKIPETAISKRGYINAVTCNKNKYGTTPRWMLIRRDRVCNGE
jgi:hypothetical protein